MARLRIVDDDGVEQLVDLLESKLQIGRGRDNDIVLPDSQKGVSRVHAELRYENGHYVIVDLQSQNGTWVNGERVERAEVPFDAEIAIGAYRLTLLKDRPAAAKAPPRRPRPDPFDDMRVTGPLEPLPSPGRAARAGMPRSVLAGAAAGVVIVGLAAVAWVAGARQGGDGGPGAELPASPPAAPATSAPAAAPASDRVSPAPDRPIEPVDLPNGSPKRAANVPAVPARSADGIARRPGESNEAWRSRAAALQMRYGYSKAALDRGDFAAAAGGFEAILLEEPGFLDAPRLLVQAQAGLRASARSLFQAGRKLDQAGDWVGALQKYEQARQVYSGIPGLAESLQRVRGKLREAGAAAFQQARQLEADGRPQEALKEYEKALQWLPADDPNHQVARARIEQLRRND